MDINTISIIAIVAAIVLVVTLLTALITKTLKDGSAQADLRFVLMIVKLHFRHYTKNFRTN